MDGGKLALTGAGAGGDGGAGAGLVSSSLRDFHMMAVSVFYRGRKLRKQRRYADYISHLL